MRTNDWYPEPFVVIEAREKKAKRHRVIVLPENTRSGWNKTRQTSLYEYWILFFFFFFKEGAPAFPSPRQAKCNLCYISDLRHNDAETMYLSRTTMTIQTKQSSLKKKKKKGSNKQHRNCPRRHA